MCNALTILDVSARIDSPLYVADTRKSAADADRLNSTFTLSQNISAIQALCDAEGMVRLGTILQLPEGTQVRICGDGFNERTVKVIWEGAYYFVFLEDLENKPLLRAWSHAAR